MRVPGRHPAGVDVRLRDAPVVAVEERDEVLREVVAIPVAERAHDAEVERDVAPVRRDEDVAGVHVGVEEPVAERLAEEDLDAGAGELRDVDALCAERGDLADRGAVHALHRHHVRWCSSPSGPPGRRAAASRGSCGAAGSRSPPRARGRARRRGVVRTRRPPRAAGSAGPPRCARRGRPRCSSSSRSRRMTGSMFGRSTFTATSVPSGSVARWTWATEALATGVGSKVANISDTFFPRPRSISAIATADGNGGTRSCSFASSSATSVRQQVASGREHLAELHEDRPERLERAAQPLAARGGVPAEEIERARGPEPASARLGGEEELVEAEAERDPEDRREAEKAGHPGLLFWGRTGLSLGARVGNSYSAPAPMRRAALDRKANPPGNKAVARAPASWRQSCLLSTSLALGCPVM